MFRINRTAIEVAMVKNNFNGLCLSKACGLSDQTIYRMLRCGQATAKTINKVAEALGVTVEEIMRI